MTRTETYLGGRLVKQIGMVNVGPTVDKPYDEWVDGRHIWLLDGEEITEADALGLIADVRAGASLPSIVRKYGG